MNVGGKIKIYLTDKGISQSHISRQTGISMPKLNLSLNDKRNLSYDEYAVICGALGVNTDFFLKPRLPETKNEARWERMAKRKLSIAERQERQNKIMKILEYVVPVIVSAVAATIFNILLLT